MALNCGIIGLTNTGKTTIFNCISNTKAEIGGFATKTNIVRYATNVLSLLTTSLILRE